MFLYTNRAKTQLARNMSVNDTTLTLMSGTGDLFPALNESNDSFPVTLASANNPDNYEIVYCIARNGDVLTVKRGQEGTPPKSFMSGDVVSLNTTAATYRRMPQAGYIGAFSAEIAASPGGYHRGALVNDESTPTLYWINLQEGNTTRPSPDNATWQALDAASIVHSPDIKGFVSGTLELTEGDHQGTGLHTRGSDQAVLYKDTSNGWRPLALQADLQAETQRAESALVAEVQRAEATEAGLVSGSYGSTPSAGDLAVQSLYYVGTLGTVSATYRQNGTLNYLALAPQQALTDETARAQSAENTKLNRTGDTSTGNIIFDSGNSYQPWAASPQSIYTIGGGLMSLWGQIDGAGNMQLVLGGNSPGQPYALPWVFNPTRKIASTPSGNNILETGNIAAPRMRQCFRVAVYNGGIITWPIPYARDELVVAHFTPTDNGSGQVHIVNLLVGTTTNHLNCVVAVATWNKWNSGNMKPDPDPVTIDVTVEGYTA